MCGGQILTRSSAVTRLRKIKKATEGKHNIVSTVVFHTGNTVGS